MLQLAPNFSAYVAPLDQSRHQWQWVSFDRWWRKEKIFRDGKHILTRDTLAFALRNQEGGSHLDPELTNSNYVRHAREGRTFVVESGKEPRVLLEKELVSIRQIAWEITQTLEAHDRKTADALV